MKTLRDYINLIESAQQGVAEGFRLRGTGNPGMPTPYDQGQADAKKGRPYDNPYDQPGEEQEHRNYRKGYEQGKQQGVAEGSLEEYGDTAKGQKMLTKVQKRAVDRVVSKKADTDPKYAKKNSDTADRAWDRMADKD